MPSSEHIKRLRTHTRLDKQRAEQIYVPYSPLLLHLLLQSRLFNLLLFFKSRLFESILFFKPRPFKSQPLKSRLLYQLLLRAGTPCRPPFILVFVLVCCFSFRIVLRHFSTRFVLTQGSSCRLAVHTARGCR